MSDQEDFNYKNIDDLIHSRIRLAIMSILVSTESPEFKHLKEKVGTTDGNLSSHLSKLEKAGYLEVNKQFIKKKPITYYNITEKGREAFEAYVEQLEKFLKL